MDFILPRYIIWHYAIFMSFLLAKFSHQPYSVGEFIKGLRDNEEWKYIRTSKKLNYKYHRITCELIIFSLYSLTIITFIIILWNTVFIQSIKLQWKYFIIMHILKMEDKDFFFFFVTYISNINYEIFLKFSIYNTSNNNIICEMHEYFFAQFLCVCKIKYCWT